MAENYEFLQSLTMFETQDSIWCLPSPERVVSDLKKRLIKLYLNSNINCTLYQYKECILECLFCEHLYRHLICKTDDTVRKNQVFFCWKDHLPYS